MKKTETRFDRNSSATGNNDFFASIQSRESLLFVQNFAKAGLIACCAKTASAPIERVKLILQSEREIIRARSFKNIEGFSALGSVRNIYRNEGILAFYRGNLASVIRYFPTQGLNFALNSRLKDFWSAEDAKQNQLLYRLLSGGLAGSISQCFCYTLDLTRTLLANDIALAKKGSKAHQYKGLSDVYMKVNFLVSCFNFSNAGLYVM